MIDDGVKTPKQMMDLLPLSTRKQGQGLDLILLVEVKHEALPGEKVRVSTH